MERGDFVLIGCGGAGGNLVDKIACIDSRYESYYFNTSLTDIQSLETHNEKIKNYYVISTQNGVGRDKELGTEFARQRAFNMIDIMMRLQQKTIYLVSSLSGGSGSSIVSVLTEEIDNLDEGVFDKKLNIISIMPSLNSPDIMLKNAKKTWNELATRKCINSRIFINNNCHIEGEDSMDEATKEQAINEKFADLFDSIFDIPVDNGTKFDTGNLTNILNDKGCLYIYDMSSDCSGMVVGIRDAEKHSVLGRMYRGEENTVITDDNKTKIKCGYLGLSTSSDIYTPDNILTQFQYNKTKEAYFGINAYERNLLLLSGCLPPVGEMALIDKEIEERKKAKIQSDTVNLDFSNFTFKEDKDDEVAIAKAESEIKHQDSSLEQHIAKKTVNQVSSSKKKNDIFKRRVR